MYDALVIGAGAMGSAALYHLATSGCRVIGVDAHAPPHALGSTHGRSRIIREAYYEDPVYVPLVRRAYENWDALAREAGVTLFTRTGAMMIGAAGTELVTGTLASATEHAIPVEELSSAAISERFPILRPAAGMIGILEKNAGILDPELCVRTHLALATAHGAEFQPSTRVLSLEARGDRVVARTDGGVIEARRVVLCAGPWVSQLLEPLGAALPLSVERQTMHWFNNAEPATPAELPVIMIEDEEGTLFYAIPDIGDGVKAAIHHDGAIVSADTVSREVTDADRSPVQALARRFIPGMGDEIRDSVTCLYTNTPTFDFVIDSLPAAPSILLISACSGHGFKFASAIGELARATVLGESLRVDVSRFRIS